jgi:hypothetical protein
MYPVILPSEHIGQYCGPISPLLHRPAGPNGGLAVLFSPYRVMGSNQKMIKPAFSHKKAVHCIPHVQLVALPLEISTARRRSARTALYAP